MKHTESNSDIKIIKRNMKNPIWVIWFKVLFPNAKPEHTFMAYGRTIFIPDKTIPQDLMIHETKHLEQQKFSYIYGLWWYIKYLFSKKFRLEMEIPAYGEQIKFLAKNKSRNEIYTIIINTVIILQVMYKLNIKETELYNQLKSYVYSY